MKNDNAFGFVIDNCNKKTVEKELEDGISSAYSNSAEDSSESERWVVFVDIQEWGESIYFFAKRLTIICLFNLDLSLVMMRAK